MDDNFELHKAYHEQQAALKEKEAAEAKKLKLDTEQAEIYKSIGILQAQYDTVKDEQNAAWNEYNSEKARLKRMIGEKITSGKEAKLLEENLRLMAENPDEDKAKAAVYLKGAEFFSKLNLENMTERDKLIDKSRNLERPDNSRGEAMLNKLKRMRSEQAEILEQYHAAKNDYTLKKANFDRLDAKYRRLNNESKTSSNTALMTNRPQKFFEESLLVKANIPEEYWADCSMMRRVDGRVDIYYGGGVGMKHGHVILDGEKIEYARQPQKVACL